MRTIPDTYWYAGIALSCSLVCSVALMVYLSAQSLTVSRIPISLDLRPFPVLKGSGDITIAAEGVFAMDSLTHTVLYEKHADLRFSPASTTKLMTALVAQDFYSPTDLLTVPAISTEGVTVGFEEGDMVTYRDLLHALLIPSSNDAALILSHHIPGGTAQFVEQMNQKAAELGLIHTHFGDPAGLEDDMNYTTPRDLMRLAMYAWQDPIIRTIVGKSDHTITTRNGKSYRVFTTNSLLGTYGITGLKTGRTIGAKEVFISVFPYKDRQIFSIVMRSNDRFGDTKLLIDQMLSRLTYLPIPLEVPGRMP